MLFFTKIAKRIIEQESIRTLSGAGGFAIPYITVITEPEKIESKTALFDGTSFLLGRKSQKKAILTAYEWLHYAVDRLDFFTYLPRFVNMNEEFHKEIVDASRDIDRNQLKIAFEFETDQESRKKLSQNEELDDTLTELLTCLKETKNSPTTTNIGFRCLMRDANYPGIPTELLDISLFKKQDTWRLSLTTSIYAPNFICDYIPKYYALYVLMSILCCVADCKPDRLTVHGGWTCISLEDASILKDYLEDTPRSQVPDESDPGFFYL